MGRIRGSRPSPAIVLAAVALVAALAGTALAGSDATTSAINKKKVKKIATKQATKQINKLAPGLSVASADTAASANTAANAQALGGKPPSAYASPTSYRIEQVNRNLPSIAANGESPPVHATCDPGERAIGGGGTASSGFLVMIDSWPLSNGTDWSVQFRNVGSNPESNPQIVAFAVCASAN
jgi:hypothetical protein